MCGGAIISDFIPAAVVAAAGRGGGRARRCTADYLWPNLNKIGSADFREFKDDSDIDVDEDDVDVKPFASSAIKPSKKPLSRGCQSSSSEIRKWDCIVGFCVGSKSRLRNSIASLCAASLLLCLQLSPLNLLWEKEKLILG
ncbi:hypothetical protein K1719_032234 [Acacia pycnantha]|nr:hypothetical protein K1719_032234 [Acacia pycnantha]